jgi:hypothetical protein
MILVILSNHHILLGENPIYSLLSIDLSRKPRHMFSVGTLMSLCTPTTHSGCFWKTISNLCGCMCFCVKSNHISFCHYCILYLKNWYQTVLQLVRIGHQQQGGTTLTLYYLTNQNKANIPKGVRDYLRRYISLTNKKQWIVAYFSSV